jgi:hypothetical protein
MTSNTCWYGFRLEQSCNDWPPNVSCPVQVLDFVKSMPMTRLLLTTPVLGRSDSGSGGRELRLTTAEDWTCEECNTVVSIARGEDKSDVIANHAATCDSKATLSPDFAMELMQPEVFLEWAAPAPAGTLAGAEGRVVVGEGKTPVGRGVMGLLDQAVSHGRKQLVFNLSSYSPLRLTVTRVGLKFPNSSMHVLVRRVRRQQVRTRVVALRLRSGSGFSFPSTKSVSFTMAMRWHCCRPERND